MRSRLLALLYIMIYTAEAYESYVLALQALGQYYDVLDYAQLLLQRATELSDEPLKFVYLLNSFVPGRPVPGWSGIAQAVRGSTSPSSNMSRQRTRKAIRISPRPKHISESASPLLNRRN